MSLLRPLLPLGVLAALLFAYGGHVATTFAGLPTEVDMDTYTSGNESPIDITGPVLPLNQVVTITIQGTFSYWFASDWQQYGSCGTPDDAPLFPSPGTTNGPAGADAAWGLGNVKFTPSSCESTYPNKSSAFGISLDGGQSFSALVVDDPGSGPNASHTYHLTVAGQGAAVVFRLSDEKTVDNYGIVKFTIDRAPLVWGDNDCLGGITALDALPELVGAAGIAAPQIESGSCPAIGDSLDTASFGTRTWGDLDCSGGFDVPDVLLLLRYLAGLPPANIADCPAIGITVTLAPI